MAKKRGKIDEKWCSITVKFTAKLRRKTIAQVVLLKSLHFKQERKRRFIYLLRCSSFTIASIFTAIESLLFPFRYVAARRFGYWLSLLLYAFSPPPAGDADRSVLIIKEIEYLCWWTKSFNVITTPRSKRDFLALVNTKLKSKTIWVLRTHSLSVVLPV